MSNAVYSLNALYGAICDPIYAFIIIVVIIIIIV